VTNRIASAYSGRARGEVALIAFRRDFPFHPQQHIALNVLMQCALWGFLSSGSVFFPKNRFPTFSETRFKLFSFLAQYAQSRVNQILCAVHRER